MLTQIGHIV